MYLGCYVQQESTTFYVYSSSQINFTVCSYTSSTQSPVQKYYNSGNLLQSFTNLINPSITQCTLSGCYLINGDGLTPSFLTLKSTTSGSPKISISTSLK